MKSGSCTQQKQIDLFVMKEEDSTAVNVTISVKTCCIEQVTHPLTKKFVAPEYSGDVVVRDIAGIITKIGPEVTRFKVGDDVIGVLPVNHFFNVTEGSCEIQEYYLVKKPPSLAWEVASSCIYDGLKAYDALQYLGRIRPQNTLLICNAASSFGVIAIQLARKWGAKVFTTARNEEEAQLLRTMSLDVERTLSGHQFMRNSMLDETGGLGVDCIVDSGVLPNHSNSEERDWSKPTKHDAISCLAVMGRWVTSQYNLQIDPPDSENIHLRNASVAHLYPDSLLLSTYQQDKVLHILDDVMKNAEAGVLRPHLMSVLPASEMSSNLFPTNKRIVLKL